MESYHHFSLWRYGCLELLKINRPVIPWDFPWLRIGRWAQWYIADDSTCKFNVLNVSEIQINASSSIIHYQKGPLYGLNTGSNMITSSPGSTNARIALRRPSLALLVTQMSEPGLMLQPKLGEYTSESACLKLGMPWKIVRSHFMSMMTSSTYCVCSILVTFNIL